MTITLPEWTLWALGLGLGIPFLLVVAFFAYVGGTIMFLAWRDWK